MRFLGFVWRVRCDFHHEVKKHNAILCVSTTQFRVAHLILWLNFRDLTHTVKSPNFNFGRKFLRFVSVEGWKIWGKIRLRGISKSTSR